MLNIEQLPGLLAKPVMKRMGVVMDFQNEKYDVRTLGLRDVPQDELPSGHPVMPIIEFGKEVIKLQSESINNISKRTQKDFLNI